MGHHRSDRVATRSPFGTHVTALGRRHDTALTLETQWLSGKLRNPDSQMYQPLEMK
jgi:hypothetical protein